MSEKTHRECRIVLGDVTVTFNGTLLAQVECVKQRELSEVVEGYVELSLFRTVTGQYVCQSRMKEDVDVVQTERLAVLSNLDEVKPFFGYGWPVDELYMAAGLTPKWGEKP